MSNQRLLDVVIPIVKIDIPTFKSNLPILKVNLPAKRFILIGSEEVGIEICNIEGVDFIDENTLIPGLTLSTIKAIKKSLSGSDKRSGWYYQQFLKMAYANICEDAYYLIWDSDTVPVKKIDFFDKSGIPYLDYREYVKYDECFFITQRQLFPNEYLRKTVNESFICEHLLVDVSIMKDLLVNLKYNGAAGKNSFYENIMFSIPKRLLNLSGFSEFETYAAFVMKKYPNSHKLRYWNNLRNAGIYLGHNLSSDNLLWISEMFDVISIEDFNPQWWICKLILRLDPKHRINFSHVYKIIQPLYNFVYNIRFKVRDIVKQ